MRRLVLARQVYSVAVLNRNGEQLTPCRPAKARILLKNRRAKVVPTNLFKIRVIDSR